MQKITIQQACLVGPALLKLKVGENRKDDAAKQTNKQNKTTALEGGGSERPHCHTLLFGPVISCTSSSVFMQETKQGDWSKDESFQLTGIEGEL